MQDSNLLASQHISVRKIKLVSMYLDEFNIAMDAVFKIDFNRTYSVDLAQNLVIINLKVTYSVPTKDNESRTVFDCLIHNVFGVENINDYIDEKKTFRVPLSTLSILVGLCITHARAIISVNTAGTAIGETLIPIVDPMEITKVLFDEAEPLPVL